MTVETKMDECVVETIPNEEIAKPQSYERYQFEGLTLKNGLQMMLMSSPNIDMASCCIGVGVGSLEDPIEYQGVAHFCEHMLFMGNDKYPDEQEYDQFITNGGGVNNACTYPQRTLYFASIKPELLAALVDRLGNFFLSPHFKADAVDREVEAVNSEFERFLSNDAMRTYVLRKRLGNPDHAYWKFFIGNNKSLRRPDLFGDKSEEALTKLREALIDFHTKYYSSDLMFAFVSGNQPLSELKQMVVPVLSQLTPKPISIPRGSERTPAISPWKVETCPKMILYSPVAAERRRIDLSFLIPDQEDHWKSKPSLVLSHILGHEGPGSVLAFLKREGLATSLRAGCDEKDVGFSIMNVSIDFTEEGGKPEQLVRIGEAVFAMVRLLAESGVPDWLLDEVTQLQTLQFKFEEVLTATSLAREMARRIRQFGLREMFAGETLIYKHDRVATMDILRRIRPDNLQMFLQAHSLEPQCQTVEPLYGSNYHETVVPVEWLNRWDEITKCDATDFEKFTQRNGLHLARPNQYIPQDLNIKNGGLGLDDLPCALAARCTFFHKQDGHFNLPLVHLRCLWRLPCIRPTVAELTEYLTHGSKLDGLQGPVFDGFAWYRRLVLVTFLIELVEESLKEEMYDAELVDSRFSGMFKDPLVPFNNGISMSVRGYSDKTHLILKKYIDQYVSLEVTEKDLSVVYSMIQRAYATRVQTQEPYETASLRVTEAFGLVEWTDHEFYDCLKGWTQADLFQILAPGKVPKWLRSGGTISGMIFGNVDATTAEQAYVSPILVLTNTNEAPVEDLCPAGVVNMLKAKPLLVSSSDMTMLNTVEVSSSHPTCFVYHGNTVNPDTPDNACVLSVQFPEPSRENEMILNIFYTMFRSKFFDDLRTKQSLGYVCYMGPTIDNRRSYVQFIIQSTRPSLYLLSRIEAFLKSVLFSDSDDFSSLKLAVSDADFNVAKSAVVALLKTTPKSMAEQQSRYTRPVFIETFDFERRKEGIKYIESLQFDEFCRIVHSAFIDTAWYAACLDSAKAEFTEPEKSEALTSSCRVKYYKMKDNKSLIRAVWSQPNRDGLIATYPISA
eukprot:Gregarina_sp_Poly_1__587@NODE_113_length_13886_cov_267_363051_g100_i0_p1_GENE_NODE_113_length_13886_cov_267_363051_g100_i0NODE_113_length_13886_cov_267_363051_g100_i0_p1_ORF_typecomplete_len1069_score163_28Peptidase_M16_M/PF16187_5/8_2e02Peptidase_M16_M/PF16187_5/2_5e43Peptidase_M16_M/PF16187_5/41Peptidase_M16/PF00675_20/3_6e30Peptidase_M16_C/PF05193_21/7_2e03Peptidase_M16_C/PF05193_21/4_6e16Peptidase_M16_C/PF05193_21/0_00024Peptidase_M16_C/PF05193_21/1_3e04_NODE_113_length_13886_cov_267_363051_